MSLWISFPWSKCLLVFLKLFSFILDNQTVFYWLLQYPSEALNDTHTFTQLILSLLEIPKVTHCKNPMWVKMERNLMKARGQKVRWAAGYTEEEWIRPR